jgi:hypothetical protein
MSNAVATKTEKRTLKMHPKLLLDVIGRQAGSLDKAMLEGGMNAQEAINALEMSGGVCKDKAVYMTYEKVKGTVEKSPRITITIKDMGKGITTKKEIEEFFETFGTPHDESEHKIYAQFRMGRGQMFNFGKNVWRTGTFELTVDVLNNGLEWELKENLPFVDGCHITIELYEKYVSSWPAHTEDCFKDAIKKQMEFISIPLIFNGEQINTPAQDCQWDFEDDFAYYLFNVGDKLAVYNLGVYVQERWETSGIIVSKRQLKLNFPRNDVMADCPIFHHIREVVRKNVIKKSKKSYTSLTKHERRAILKDVRDSRQEYSDARTVRVLQTVQDKYISFNMFLKNNQPWTIAPIGNNRGDNCQQRGSHMVFAREMLEALNYSGDDCEFFDWLMDTIVERHRLDEDRFGRQFDCYKLEEDYKVLKKKKHFYETLKEASSGLAEKFVIIASNKLKKTEKRLLSVMTDFGCWDDRVLRIGLGTGANAWTDGACFINLDRNYLNSLDLNWDGDIAKLFSTMAHELAHDNDNSMTDIHGEDFYKNYHDITNRRGYSNPFAHMVSFKDKMRSALVADRQEQQKKKEQEALAEKAKKLGIVSP